MPKKKELDKRKYAIGEREWITRNIKGKKRKLLMERVKPTKKAPNLTWRIRKNKPFKKK